MGDQERRGVRRDVVLWGGGRSLGGCPPAVARVQTHRGGDRRVDGLTGWLECRSLNDLPEDDWRRTNPRFQEAALRENLQLADRVTALAEKRGVSPAQLALACVLAKGADVVPIPGTKSPRRLEENAAAVDVTLSAGELQELDDAISHEAVVGSRYPEQMMALLNN